MMGCLGAPMDLTTQISYIELHGQGIVIDEEMIEGCSSLTSIDELYEMDEEQAAMLAGHIFCKHFGSEVQQQNCSDWNLVAMEWEGNINGYRFEITKAGDEWMIDFNTDSERKA